MKKFRVYKLTDTSATKKGEIEIRLDEEDTSIFKKIKPLGMKLTKRLYKVDWIEDTYAEIVNRFTDKEIAQIELVR